MSQEMADCSENGIEAEEPHSRKSPFSIQLLRGEIEHGGIASQLDHDQLLSLLPASYRTGVDDLAPAGRQVTACIEKELDIDRLVGIQNWLWLAGRPMPPRPLHHHLVLGREIMVTERLDLHLVWTTGRMFFKPLSRFLLEPVFWTKYLTCEVVCVCSNKKVIGQGHTKTCDERLWRRALGFLFSYAALISHESDFRIAKEKHLLPPEISWPAWRIFVEQLETERIYPHIDPRFHHGELRLSRLNKIYRLRQKCLNGYLARWNGYGDFIFDNFALLAGSTVYIVIVLAAMQVGLATNLRDDDAFQAASYGFTIFSILGPLISAVLILLVFSSVFLYNWAKTVNYRKRRLASISRQFDQRT